MSDPVVEFLERDQGSWIFPLRTAAVFARADSGALRDYTKKILDPSQPDAAFLAGHVAHARKDAVHLRRVLLLDPISCFFLYDFVHKHRARFPRPKEPQRFVFGHFFEKSKATAAFAEYHRFRRQKYELIARHGHFAQLDVFNCFNSFYHHEVASFVNQRVGADAGDGFGQFLRELNAGVSVACFPQGLYPAKVIGNAYLSMLETSRQVRITALARFLDDIVLAGSSAAEVEDAVGAVQQLLDKHNLSLNDSKTLIGQKGQHFKERKLDKIKKGLLAKRESASDYEDDGEGEPRISQKERTYLLELIQRPNIAQEDIELALRLLRGEGDALAMLAAPVIERAPHLLRVYHKLAGDSPDPNGVLWDAIQDRLKADRALSEHDLFWIARILIDHYEFGRSVADNLLAIYERSKTSHAVRAAILETEYLEYGFADLKESALRAEGTTLLAAAAMVGLARLDKGKRNHIFKYVARNGSHAAALVKIAGRI